MRVAADPAGVVRQEPAKRLVAGVAMGHRVPRAVMAVLGAVFTAPLCSIRRFWVVVAGATILLPAPMLLVVQVAV